MSAERHGNLLRTMVARVSSLHLRVHLHRRDPLLEVRPAAERVAVRLVDAGSLSWIRSFA